MNRKRNNPFKKKLNVSFNFTAKSSVNFYKNVKNLVIVLLLFFLFLMLKLSVIFFAHLSCLILATAWPRISAAAALELQCCSKLWRILLQSELSYSRAIFQYPSSQRYHQNTIGSVGPFLQDSTITDSEPLLMFIFSPKTRHCHQTLRTQLIHKLGY